LSSPKSLALPVVDKGARFNFPSVHPLDVTDGARDILQKADFILALTSAICSALDHGEQANRESDNHLRRREDRQHLDERYAGALLGQRFPSAPSDRYSNVR
jgi:hypothetical protein